MKEVISAFVFIVLHSVACNVTGPVKSRHHLVHAEFGSFVPVTRRSQIVSAQRGDQNRGLGAKGARDMANLLVMVSIILLKYIDEFSSRSVDASSFRIKGDIVNHIYTRKGCHNFARIGIENDECRRLATGEKQPMICLIKG